MKKFFIRGLCMILIAALTVIPFEGAAVFPIEAELTAKNIYMVNVDTGMEIFSVDADEKVYPASTTKVMTALVALTYCGDLENTLVTVDERALSDLYGTGSSLSGIKSGEVIPMLDLLYCLLLPSGNDAALAIAYFVGGDIANFVEMMNTKAEALGCTNTHFANPHGLHDENHYTSAHDLYLMTMAAMEFPIFKEIVSSDSYTIYPTNLSKQRKVTNTNYMLNRYTDSYYSPTTGVKTGRTTQAGNCLISSATKNGYTYILVTMGAPTEGVRVNPCFKEAQTLFRWAFNNLTLKQVVTSGEVMGEVDVELAWNIDHVSIAPAADFKTLMPKDVDVSAVLPQIEKAESVTAPVKKGDVLGKVTLLYANNEIGQVDLVATEDIERSEFLFALKTVSKIVTSPLFIVCAMAFIALVVAYIVFMLKYNKKSRKSSYSRRYGTGSYKNRRYR